MVSMESSGRLADVSDLSVREAEASCKGEVVSQTQLAIGR